VFNCSNCKVNHNFLITSKDVTIFHFLIYYLQNYVAHASEKCYLCSHNLATTMEIYFTGIIIAVSTFLIIGLCHPLVIKTEYYSGTKLWWTYLVAGLAFVAAAFFIENVIISSILGVTGASLLWGIGELFAQKKRVEKGWFPMNPKRKHEYKVGNNECLCPIHGKKMEHPANYHNK